MKHKILALIALSTSLTLAALISGCAALDTETAVDATGQTNTVYTVKPSVQTVLTTTGEIAKVVPEPGGSLLTLALATATAGLTWFARYKTTQAATSQRALATVVKAVELVPETSGQAVKDIVALTSRKDSGVLAAIEQAH